MAETTGIAWTDATFNPWIGCTKVGPGCDHCYASVSTPARTLGVVWGAGQPRRRTSESNWKKPLAWNAQPFSECMACGWRGEKRDTKEVMNPIGFHPAPGAVRGCPKCDAHAIKEARRRVFCASLADVFDNEVPEAWRTDLFSLIYSTPKLDWLLLTKRIGNAEKMLDGATRDTRRNVGASHGAPAWAIVGDSPWRFRPWPNVWLGATIANQPEADRDIPKLLATPAAKRFVSYEPALGPVDWREFLPGERETGQTSSIFRSGLDWIIVGGESAQPGYPARPFDIEWARDTVRQCREAGVAVFVKQMGSALRVRNDSMEEWPDEDAFCDAIPEEYRPAYQGELVCIRLKDRAGANPAEWPADLRVREFPNA